MAKNIQPPAVPVVLELAPLPREQVGPFLLLGVDKNADKAQIEAAWAQRIIWARKRQIKTPLEDINWSREVINDPEKRLKADAASLNIDTTEQVLRRLRERFGGGSQSPAQPLDVEKPLAGHVLDIAIPDTNEIRAAVPAPEVPQELPALRKILEEFASATINPWDVGGQ